MYIYLTLSLYTVAAAAIHSPIPVEARVEEVEPPFAPVTGIGYVCMRIYVSLSICVYIYIYTYMYVYVC